MIQKENIQCYGAIFTTEGKRIVARFCGYKRALALDPLLYILAPEDIAQVFAFAESYRPEEIIFENGVEPPELVWSIIQGNPVLSVSRAYVRDDR